MRFLRAIGLAAVAAALPFFVIAGPASATVIEDEEGHVAFFRASDEAGIVFHLSIGSVSCGISGLQARALNTGGPAEAVRAHVRVLSFRWCRDTVNVLREGQLEIHATGSADDGDGRLTSNGMRIAVEYHGVPCVFETKNTDVGALTGADTTGYVATIDLDGAIPRAGGGGGVFCGPTAAWTGSYQVVVGFSNVT